MSDKAKYIAPRNEVEKKVVKIWSEVLGIEEEKVGIKDDFFRLGGNSILAIKVISKINNELGDYVGVSVIFKEKNIGDIVHYILHS